MRLLAPWALHYAANTAAFALRTALFARTSFEKKDDEEKIIYILAGGALYSLPFGPTVDLLVNTVAAIKYNKTMAGAFSGKLGYVYDSVDAVLDLWRRNSAHNNKAERRAAKALYRLLVMPALGVGVGLFPAARLPATLFGMAAMWGGSADAQQAFADAAVGYSPEEKEKMARDEAKAKRDGKK